MAQSTLVDWDISSGARVLDALREENIPVEHAYWSADAEENAPWVLHIITPLYEQDGPRKTLDRIENAFRKAGISDRLRGNLQVSGPQGISAKLQQHLSSPGLTSSPAVSGAYMPFIVPYVGGTIGILLEDATSNRFRVTFSPYQGRGGALVRKDLDGTISLTSFLIDTLKIDEYIAREAVVRAAMTGRWSIPNVNLSEAELKEHGLAQ